MKDENTTPEEFNEEEIFGDFMNFNKLLGESLTPTIKQFLQEYFGEQFFDFDAETYLEIDRIITHTFRYGTYLPDTFYRNRIITDEDEFDKALDNFVPPKKAIVWPVLDCWFHANFEEEEEEDEDTFLEDSDPIDLTEEQRHAKKIIECVDDMVSDMQKFARFMKAGYANSMKPAQQFLEHNASFDLWNLTPEGYIAVQGDLNQMISILYEDLAEVIRADWP